MFLNLSSSIFSYILVTFCLEELTFSSNYSVISQSLPN